MVTDIPFLSCPRPIYSTERTHPQRPQETDLMVLQSTTFYVNSYVEAGKSPIQHYINFATPFCSPVLTEQNLKAIKKNDKTKSQPTITCIHSLIQKSYVLIQVQ